MTTDYPKKLNYKSKGRRNIGRPQTRWADNFREEGTGQVDDDELEKGISVNREICYKKFILISFKKEINRTLSR